MPTDAASVTFRPSGKVMVVNVDNPPVNALGVDVRRGLVSAIDAAESDDSIAAVLIEEVAIAAKVQLNHVPFRGNADLQQALLGGHVMAQSDATGWDKFVDGGQMRLLLTFGEKRTKRWPNVPTAKELGYGVVSQSPYGIVGPKGMDPAVVKVLHDAFRKAMDDPKHLALLDELNQDLWYRSGDDYAKWARETFVKDKALIERLGLAAK